MRYGHATIEGSLASTPVTAWLEPGCCGDWSIRDVVAHLASYEWALADAITWLTEQGGTGDLPPTLDKFVHEAAKFNEERVAACASLSPEAVLQDYRDAQARVTISMSKVDPALSAQAGLLPWYGSEYSLDDFIVYTCYGHKREHAAQIDHFRDHHL
jgi:hypothetical protein